MSEPHRTFVTACLAGEAKAGDIDDWVQAWHDSDDGMSLDEYLGFTETDGALWAEHPEFLTTIIESHRTQWY